jgi:L-asparaginase
MSKNYIKHTLFFMVIFLVGQVHAADKPNIVILATGGTIAGSAASQTQAGYTSGQVGRQYYALQRFANL